MIRVQANDSKSQKFTSAEIQEVREWLEDLVEDQLNLTDTFDAEIQQSEHEMAAGALAESRQPEAGR